jgi:glycosyltransferase involved in cell wall biosynthesis
MRACIECFKIGDPVHGSERRAGYYWLYYLSQVVDECVLFTSPDNLLPKLPPNCKVVVVPFRWWLRWGTNRPWIYHIKYFLKYRTWLRDVLKEARKQGPFDIAMHGSDNNLLLGTDLWKLDCPLILAGSGTDPLPPGFRRIAGFFNRCRELFTRLYQPHYLRGRLFGLAGNGNSALWFAKRGVPCRVLPDALPTHTGSAAKAYRKAPAQKKYLLWYSHSAPRKGGAILQEAWRRAAPSHLELRTAGKMKLEGPAIVNLGYISTQALLEQTGGALAVVVPSYREGVTTASAEALSMGVPVITFKGVGIGSVESADSFCHTVDASTDPIAALAETFRQLDRGDLDLSPFEEAGYQKSLELWSQEKRLEALREILRHFGCS